MSDDPELGRGSLWMLRAVSVLVVATIVWFLVDAAIG